MCSISRTLGLAIEVFETGTKSQLKKLIKTNINKDMIKQVQAERHKTKMRFVCDPINFDRKSYILKMGGYALLRFNVQILPEVHLQIAPALIILGIINNSFEFLNSVIL